MNKRLYDVINGKEENYMLPFYWQHGGKRKFVKEVRAAAQAELAEADYEVYDLTPIRCLIGDSGPRWFFSSLYARCDERIVNACMQRANEVSYACASWRSWKEERIPAKCAQETLI